MVLHCMHAMGGVFLHATTKISIATTSFHDFWIRCGIIAEHVCVANEYLWYLHILFSNIVLTNEHNFYNSILCKLNNPKSKASTSQPLSLLPHYIIHTLVYISQSTSWTVRVKIVCNDCQPVKTD